MPKRVLIFIDWYPPAFKAGGPIRSCENFAEHMKDDFEIFVFTSDRDLGDLHAMKGIEPDRWLQANKEVRVFYASPASLNWSGIRKQIDQLKPDFIYLNSMYSKYFTLFPLLMKYYLRISPVIVLSPRGMLKNSALNFKRRKKQFFFLVFKMLKIQRYIRFHATDDQEQLDIKRKFGANAYSLQAANFPGFQRPFAEPVEKKPGELKMIFAGRIHPIKNLHFLLNCMASLKGAVELTIVGAPDDINYGEECKKLITALPANIKVQIIESLPHHQLQDALFQHHIFVLPTQGENFGHAIFEALAIGRPVLISDQTPWKNLEKQQIGWDLPLDKPALFIDAIRKATEWDQETFNRFSRNAWHYIAGYLKESNLKEKYLLLFSN